MKISFGIIVVNGEPFIKYNLENLYPHAYEILIVEGAVEKYKHAATPDGHSLDDTVKVINEFPDPENKIKLIQHQGFWPDKDEMSNAYMDQCTGDYIWQVDVDEFYKPNDIEKVRCFLVNNPDVSRIDIQTINFWHGFKAVMKGASYCYGADKFRRIFKFKPGYRFLTHRPPTVINNDGKVCCDTKVISAEELFKQLNIQMYHYSYVFEDSVKSKVDYYSRMGWGAGCEDGVRWAKTEWSKLTNPLRVHLIDFPPSWIVPFMDEHPAVIQRLIHDIGYLENPTVERHLQEDWKKYAQIGECICDIFKKVKNRQINKYLAISHLISKLIFPTHSHSIRVDLVIIKSAIKLIGAN